MQHNVILSEQKTTKEKNDYLIILSNDSFSSTGTQHLLTP